jgi:hypothetical protein
MSDLVEAFEHHVTQLIRELNQLSEIVPRGPRATMEAFAIGIEDVRAEIRRITKHKERGLRDALRRYIAYTMDLEDAVAQWKKRLSASAYMGRQLDNLENLVERATNSCKSIVEVVNQKIHNG